VIFPDFPVPKMSQIRLRPEKYPRTLAIIRPDALEQFRGTAAARLIQLISYYYYYLFNFNALDPDDLKLSKFG